MELTGGSDFYCSKFETGEGLILCSLKAPLENKGHLNRADRVITECFGHRGGHETHPCLS